MSYRYRVNPRDRLSAGNRRFGYGGYGHGGYEALDNRHVFNYRVGRQICPQENRNVSSVPPVDTEILKVEEIDFNIAANTRSHKTMEYDIVEGLPMASPQLVVRRGQPFDITVYFNRAYNAKLDDLRLNFDIGDQPMVNKKTHVDFILSDKDLPKQWGAKGKAARDNALSLKIFTPPDLYIGKWRFTVDIVKKGREDDKDSVHRFSKEEPIYILFNPWNPDDQVYMPDTNKLNEYILNQMGKIYIGNCKQISSRQWNFGQFESVILDCAIDLLDNSNMPMTSRGDAVQLARKISALVNAPDDDGILVGNWSGNYRGGNPPQSWLGSVAIIEQFYRSKSPVQFGQCWVFSGLVTSICRALGLPARSVTNFASAHDSDGSITIDCHFNDIGEPLDEYNHDSVWNFHVWNDVWMARPDLPAGYGGWQAIDATPQERSDGVFCAGPMSLVAIKKGEVTLPYDGPFLFAEVNADKVMWVQCGSTWRKILKKGVIGKKISTKKCSFRMAPVISCNSRQDDPDREDVTGEYKYPEDRCALKKNSTPPKKSSCLYICQHCLVHLGDIARYRLQVEQAQTYYWHAANLVPYNGQPYNQLAIVEAARSNKLATVFYYIRSLAVRYPFPVAATNLEKFYAKITKDMNDFKGKLSMSEVLTAFLQFHALVHLSTDLSRAASLSERLLASLPGHIQSQSLQAHVLVQVIAINMFAMYHAQRHTSGSRKHDENIPVEIFSTDENRCYQMVLHLTVSILDILLQNTPKLESKTKETFTLPAAKVILDWLCLKDDRLSHKIVKSSGFWTNLSKIINNISDKGLQKSDVEDLPLPEDVELRCFLPIEKAHSDLMFARLPAEGLTAEVEMRLRCHRLTKIGEFVVKKYPGLLNLKPNAKSESHQVLLNINPPDQDLSSSFEKKSSRQNVAIQAIMQKQQKQDAEKTTPGKSSTQIISHSMPSASSSDLSRSPKYILGTPTSDPQFQKVGSSKMSTTDSKTGTPYRPSGPSGDHRKSSSTIRTPAQSADTRQISGFRGMSGDQKITAPSLYSPTTNLQYDAQTNTSFQQQPIGVFSQTNMSTFNQQERAKYTSPTSSSYNEQDMPRFPKQQGPSFSQQDGSGFSQTSGSQVKQGFSQQDLLSSRYPPQAKTGYNQQDIPRYNQQGKPGFNQQDVPRFTTQASAGYTQDPSRFQQQMSPDGQRFSHSSPNSAFAVQQGVRGIGHQSPTGNFRPPTQFQQPPPQFQSRSAFMGQPPSLKMATRSDRLGDMPVVPPGSGFGENNQSPEVTNQLQDYMGARMRMPTPGFSQLPSQLTSLSRMLSPGQPSSGIGSFSGTAEPAVRHLSPKSDSTQMLQQQQIQQALNQQSQLFGPGAFPSLISSARNLPFPGPTGFPNAPPPAIGQNSAPAGAREPLYDVRSQLTIQPPKSLGQLGHTSRPPPSYQGHAEGASRLDSPPASSHGGYMGAETDLPPGSVGSQPVGTYSLFSKSPWSVHITSPGDAKSHGSSPFSSQSSSMRNSPDPLSDSFASDSTVTGNFNQKYSYSPQDSRWGSVAPPSVQPEQQASEEPFMANSFQSIWSSSGPSPLERLLEIQKQQRQNDPH